MIAIILRNLIEIFEHPGWKLLTFEWFKFAAMQKKFLEEFSALASKNIVADEKRLAQISRQIWNINSNSIQRYDDFNMDV